MNVRLIFLYILIQNEIKKHIVDQILGGRACCAPSKSATEW